MRTSIMIAVMAVALTAMSFKMYQPGEKIALKTGSYGLCSCDDSDKRSWRIELIFNEDHTFQYFNSSDPKKIIDIKGSWTSKGKVILLESYQSEFSIHDKWKIDDNGVCLVSRKGLNFTRLCHIKSCKKDHEK